jgi:hypothetical protein
MAEEQAHQIPRPRSRLAEPQIGEPHGGFVKRTHARLPRARLLLAGMFGVRTENLFLYCHRQTSLRKTGMSRGCLAADFRSRFSVSGYCSVAQQP